MTALELVTLYGSGAVVLHSGKQEFRARDGILCVPENMVAQAEKVGYHRTRSGSDSAPVGVPEGTVSETLVVELPPVAAALESQRDENPAPVTPEPVVAPDDDRVARYRKEAEERGYSGEAVDQIVSERLAFDELVAGGMSEEDAAKTVWGGLQAADEANNGAPDVGALSADVNDGDTGTKNDDDVARADFQPSSGGALTDEDLHDEDRG